MRYICQIAGAADNSGERLHVGGGDRGPGDGVEEGGEAFGRIEAGGSDLGE